MCAKYRVATGWRATRRMSVNGGSTLRPTPGWDAGRLPRAIGECRQPWPNEQDEKHSAGDLLNVVRKDGIIKAAGAASCDWPT